MTTTARNAATVVLRELTPRITLATLPTPLVPAATLATTLDLDALQIKNDGQTGKVYGGNKVRKLEFLFGDAMHRGCDCVITFGAAGSNHALATAIYATRLGLKCHVVMSDQPVTPYIAQTLRYHALLGTNLVLANDYGESIDIADQLAAHHPTGARRLYRIPWGGSSPLGALGFVNAAFELADQCGDIAPDVIYVACGTMGTVAGLALGLRLAGLKTRINAVSVVPPSLSTATGIAGLFVAANQKLHEIDTTIPLLEDPLVNLTLRDEFFGSGYAETTSECTQAVALIHNTEDITLEMTYTGNALAALIHDARRQRLTGQRVVFWNTYNTRPYPPAVNAAQETSLPDWARHYLPTATDAQ